MDRTQESLSYMYIYVYPLLFSLQCLYLLHNPKLLCCNGFHPGLSCFRAGRLRASTSHPNSVNACAAVNAIITLLHAESAATPFCSSLLHITPQTHVLTASSTPARVLITSTTVATNMDLVNDNQLFTSVYATTYTSNVTDVLLYSSDE